MAAGVLYTYPENFRAYKALIAAQYSGADVKVAPNFVFGETNKSAEFLKKFPAGKVPAYESADGKVLLSESNAIAYYVSSAALRGADAATQASVWQWASWADSELLPASCAWVFPYLGIMQFNKQNVERAKQDLLAALKVLDGHLLTRTFLVGERITLADIIVFCTLIHAFQHVLEPATRATLVSVTRWFNTLAAQAPVRSVLPDVALCSAPPTYDPKKYAELAGNKKESGDKKKEKKAEKKEQPKKAQKEEEAPLEPKEPAQADPFDSLPKGHQWRGPVRAVHWLDDASAQHSVKLSVDALTQRIRQRARAVEHRRCAISHAQRRLATLVTSQRAIKHFFIPVETFNMDDFKRCYSNEDEAKSIPYFWEKFDPENYSIWYAEYKYPEELAKVFMSCNLITGMFQRLDKMRKQAFASVCLFGGDNDSSISGVWVWRGQELAFTLSPDWQIDYESYAWRKLDPAAPDTKQLVQDYFSWSGTDKQGRKFNQGKIFK